MEILITLAVLGLIIVGLNRRDINSIRHQVDEIVRVQSLLDSKEK
jgi:hypothetical protein